MTRERGRPRAWEGAGACVLWALASGCVATQRNVLDLAQQTDAVGAQVRDLKKSLASMQANQADLSVKMDQVRSDLSAFTETLKDSQASMSRLSLKLDDLLAVVDQRVSKLGETLSRQQQATVTAVQAAAQTAAQGTAQKVAEEVVSTALQKAREEAQAAAQAPTPSQIYHAAQGHLVRGQHELAVEGFKAYLEKHPRGEVADLATYYLGEAHFRLKAWEEAARQFATVLDRFPTSDLTPSARLRYASCLINLKTALPEAMRYLQSIPEDFPRSPEAAEARRLLKAHSPPPGARGPSAPRTRLR